jgi:hypothetical protein
MVLAGDRGDGCGGGGERAAGVTGRPVSLRRLRGQCGAGGAHSCSRGGRRAPARAPVVCGAGWVFLAWHRLLLVRTAAGQDRPRRVVVVVEAPARVRGGLLAAGSGRRTAAAGCSGEVGWVVAGAPVVGASPVPPG